MYRTRSASREKVVSILPVIFNLNRPPRAPLLSPTICWAHFRFFLPLPIFPHPLCSTLLLLLSFLFPRNPAGSFDQCASHGFYERRLFCCLESSHVRAIAHQSTGLLYVETYTRVVALLRSSVYTVLQSRNYKNTIRADQPLLFPPMPWPMEPERNVPAKWYIHRWQPCHPRNRSRTKTRAQICLFNHRRVSRNFAI